LQRTSEIRWQRSNAIDPVDRDQHATALTIEQLTNQATHDALTGLLNRRGMFETWKE
jgi:GGDEF domain-containing protein